MRNTARWAPALAWIAVAAVTAALVVGNAREAIRRYRALDSGWSWDLAYYNQWFWSLTRGDGQMTVRPMAFYGQEDMSIWRSNYLAPIRLAIAPIYALRPGPETLLVVEAFLLWMVVPAAFVLARAETGSNLVGLAMACLVPLTPLLGPIAQNDFRELQLGIPFIVLAVEGVRSRRRGLAAAGIVGMLACRQEFAVMVASLALVPPRRPEDLGRTARWARWTVLTGAVWWLLFLFYLGMFKGWGDQGDYLEQFTAPKAPFGFAAPTTVALLLLGLGSWPSMLVGLPRMWLVVLPWAWSVARAGYGVPIVGTEGWASVRYMAPLAGIGIAAGLAGLGRLARLTEVPGSPGGTRAARLGLVAIAGVGLFAARAAMDLLHTHAPAALRPAEAEELSRWIARVGPDDGVLADYSVAAPLSSRKTLRSYRMQTDRPVGYPDLGPDYQWVFARHDEVAEVTLTGQGFEVVSRGETLWVYHRADPGSSVPNGPDYRTPRQPPFRFELEDYNRIGLALGPVGLVVWSWWRLRRAWRSASSRRPAGAGLPAPLAVVADAPRDLADPAHGVVRVSGSTAAADHEAARALVAVESSHLRLALSAGPIARLARYRPALTIAARLLVIAGLLAVADALATGGRPLLDLGIQVLGAAVILGLIAAPLEYLAVRRSRREMGDLDAGMLAALPWRHVAETFPIPWRR
jgi:hypothetical protein